MKVLIKFSEYAECFYIYALGLRKLDQNFDRVKRALGHVNLMNNE
jgi:hypothetical protein